MLVLFKLKTTLKRIMFTYFRNNMYSLGNAEVTGHTTELALGKEEFSWLKLGVHSSGSGTAAER